MATTHPNTTTGETQCDRILRALQSTPGTWMGMPELARIGAASPNGFCMVHSRVADLRKRGHVIEQSSEHVGKEVHSFYRIVTSPVESIP